MAIVVDSNADVNDGNVSSGNLCLREAIEMAAPGEVIQFAITGTIQLTSGQLNINKSLTIDGPGAANLSIVGMAGSPTAGDGKRIFDVYNNLALINVTIRGLTLTGGDAGGGNDGVGGGAIRNQEHLTVEDCTLKGNSARIATKVDGGAVFGTSGSLIISRCAFDSNSGNAGGAIGIAGGSLTVDACTFTGNQGLYGGAIAIAHSIDAPTIHAELKNSSITGNECGNDYGYGGGGGVFLGKESYLSILGSLLSGNQSYVSGLTLDPGDFDPNVVGGGAIYAGEASHFTISGSEVRDNRSTYQGGGIFSRGQLSVKQSTISGNITQAGNGGGGGGVNATSHLLIEQSTLAGNRADGGGGGLWINHSTGHAADVVGSTISGNLASVRGPAVVVLDAPAQIRHSTITANVAAGEFFFGSMGVDVDSPFPLVLDNSIVAGNYREGNPAFTRDVSSGVVAKFSIIGNTDEFVVDDGGSQIGSGTPIDARLGPLADNGGPTFTHAPLPDSPARNTGHPAPSSFVTPANDQRGVGYARIALGRIDVGAVEVQLPSANFKLDDYIDGADFLRWQQHFGTPAPEGLKSLGDADNDLDVDVDDFAAWSNSFGNPALVAAADSAVAAAVVSGEPASALTPQSVDAVLAWQQLAVSWVGRPLFRTRLPRSR